MASFSTSEPSDPSDTETLTSIVIRRSVPLSSKELETISKASPLSPDQVRQVAAAMQARPSLSLVADTATTNDRLGFRPLVKTLAGMVLSTATETPLAIAVDGKWGSGKTSILKMIERQARLSGFSVIWLNAWALESAEQLIAELTAGIQDELVRNGRTPSSSFTERLGVFAAQALAALVPSSLGGRTVRELVGAHITTAEQRGNMTEIASIVRARRSFEELVKVLLGISSPQSGAPPTPEQHRLVVLIDDLDRALPDQVTVILRNLKLLLDMEGCVFLLAMDVDLVAKGVEDFYRARYQTVGNVSVQAGHSSTVQMDIQSGPGSFPPGYGREYLEKLVQIILPVPRLTRTLVIDCVRSFGFADEAVEIVMWAPAAEILNPRRLKRYLNTLSVTLQLVMAYSLPEEFDNVYALRALALRRDWRKVYDHLSFLGKIPGGRLPAIEWPQNGATTDHHAAFRAYLAKLRPETGALARFERFLVDSNLSFAQEPPGSSPAMEEFARERLPLDWATTQNSLGNAPSTLGERESGMARLEETVAAYRTALKERTRKSWAPLDWATTQDSLGNALSTLGERERGTARLEEAVAAYRAALKERTRKRAPLDWATTQDSLGNALSTLGERERGTARLEEAVAAYRAALEERTRERMPLDWATTQDSLGNALSTLGKRERGTARLEEAVAAYRAALEERTRERMPLDWATTQDSLGNALSTLGERERGTARLEEAVAAYRAALEERTRERMPLDWATTQDSLGNALSTLGKRERGTARLEEAVAAYRAALEERTRERMPLDWATTQDSLGNALSTLGKREGGTARLEEAVAAYRAALEERTRERMPLDWAHSQYALANALAALAEREKNAARMEEALACIRGAIEIYQQGEESDWLPIARHRVTEMEAELAELRR